MTLKVAYEVVIVSETGAVALRKKLSSIVRLKPAMTLTVSCASASTSVDVSRSGAASAQHKTCGKLKAQRKRPL